MIVVCTGCSAKFKVADEKVGPTGAKLRCSRCHAVFMVRREEPLAAAPSFDLAPAPDPSPAPARPAAVPPPLPRRASTAASITGLMAPSPSPELGAPVDARSAFEIDLEPAAPRGAPEFDPFAPPPPDELFAAAFPPVEAPPAPTDPFGLGGGADPDPFAAVQAPILPELRREPQAAEPDLADDPFAAELPPLGGAHAAGDLALEERTTPRPRAARPQSSAPLDDPFGAPDDPGQLSFDGGHPGDIPPMSHELPGEPFGGYAPAGPSPDAAPALTPAQLREAPLRVDPFAAAAVDADPLPVGAPSPAAAATRAAGAEEEVPDTLQHPLSRLRSAAVNAVSLLVLLMVALALLVVWRGNVPLAEAVHPSALLAALTHRDRTPMLFAPQHVASGLYERARGAPLLFVRGEVVSHAPAAVPGVRVAVELVKAGQVVARGEALAGGVLSPEELHGAADAAALARASATAEERAPAPVQPGQTLPFLVALIDYPADLSGVALRVTAAGEVAR